MKPSSIISAGFLKEATCGGCSRQGKHTHAQVAVINTPADVNGAESWHHDG